MVRRRHHRAAVAAERISVLSAPPLFSVVVPTYNRAAFIGATLRTVLAQTYPHYEIIVVDNCSTDDTDDVLRPFIEAGRIRFIRHERNLERASSRNTGMGVARGDFVTLLDSDDFMYPDNLADAAEYARRHPDLRCFHNRYELVDERRRVLHHFPLPSLGNRLRSIAGGNFMSCIGDFIHRDIYRRYRFDTCPELSGSEDWLFWLRVLADHPVGRIETVNSGVLQHPGRSVQTQSLEGVRESLERLYAKVVGDPHLSEVYRPYLGRIRASSLLYLAIMANGAGAFAQARRHLRAVAATDARQLTTFRYWRAARRAVLGLRPGADRS